MQARSKITVCLLLLELWWLISKTLKEGDQNSFILIENNQLTKKERDKINKYTSLCLGQKDVIKYINHNFICYKFNPSTGEKSGNVHGTVWSKQCVSSFWY